MESFVAKTMPFAPSPSHHHKYIGGMVTIPSHGWFIVLTTQKNRVNPHSG